MSRIAVIGIIGNSVFLPVEKFHVGGETVEASSVHFEPGGKGFNQAVAAARCGATVSFLAAVGREYGREFAEFLDGEGIRHTLVKKDDSTAFAAIVTDKAGSNHVTVYQGAQLSENDVLLFEGEIRNADVLLLNNEVSEAVNIIKCVVPRVAYLTHASHRIGLHSELEHRLPEGVKMAYDGLEIEINE